MAIKREMEKVKRNLEKYRDNLAIFSSIGKVEEFTEGQVGVSDSYRKEYPLNEIDTDRIDEEIKRVNHTIATIEHIITTHQNRRTKK
jgi:hypothetical protein